MFIPELSPYSYSVGAPLQGVAAVGWLDEAHPRSQGKLPGGLLDKLRVLCKQLSIRKTFGYHSCPFCGACPAHEGTEEILCLGSAEIWVPASGRFSFFAAPDMILHYCIVHEYMPPEPFLDALAGLDLSSTTREVIAARLRDVSEEIWQELEVEIASSVSLDEALKVIAARKKAKNAPPK